MPADISASPNPLYASIWSVSQTRPTTITWDTGDPAVEGTVWITDDAGKRKFVDRNGKPAVGPSGTAPTVIGLGKTVLFELKRTDTPALNLDTVLVVCREELGLPVGALDDLRHRLPLIQGITNLRVFPAIDSVRIMFKTRQPTTPVIDIKDSVTHALAGAAFPFLQGASTSHDFAFPLAQNTDFAFHILAPTAPGSVTKTAAEASGLFRTGFRNARVFFDHVFVHTDGDPGSLGDGDFTFDMGAGDIDSGDVLGAVQLVADISGGEDRAIDNSVDIPGSPVGLWVQVRAEENDSYGTPYGALPQVAFAPEGSTWRHLDFGSGEMEIATVTKWFDLSGAGPVAQEIPFTLETGPKHIDFSLTGRVRMEARQGVVVQPQFTKSAKPTVRTKTVAMMASGERVAVGGRRTHLVQLAQDGGLYHAYASDSTQAGDRPKSVRWGTRLAGELQGPLTVVAMEDVLHLFALGNAGEVLHRAISPDAVQPAHGNQKWASLGGSFVWPLAVAATPQGIELFALDAGGGVFHRSLRDTTTREWPRIGEGMTGSLNAFTTPRGEIGLVALGRDGKVMCLSWSVDRAHSPDWQALGKAPTGALSAECIDDVVVLAVLADDETVQGAPWRNYPEVPARLEWQKLGSIDALVSARYSLLQPQRTAAGSADRSL